MCCGAAQTVLETGAPISRDGSQDVERLDGGREEQPRSSGAGERGEQPAGWSLPSLCNVVLIEGDRRGKPSRCALQRRGANEGREQGINVGKGGF